MDKPEKIPIPLFPKRVWQEAIDARNEIKDMFGTSDNFMKLLRGEKTMTKRDIARILRESVFNCKDATGLMRTILDVDDTDYYINRAIECVKVAQITSDPNTMNEQLTLAISLLALVKYETMVGYEKCKK